MADGANVSALRTVVAGTDFSDAARLAMEAASDVARSHGALLVLVHAVDPMVATLDVAPTTIMDDVRAGMKQAAEALQANGANVQTQVRLGKPWWAINEAARETDADLVVVASHGRSGFAKFALGNTADRVVQACAAPVLLIPVRKGDTQSKSSPSAWRSAVVGIDFSEESRLAAATAAKLLRTASSGGATLTLFHTVMLTIDFSGADAGAALPGQWDQTERLAQEQLERLAASIRTPSLEVRAVTHRGYAPDGILSEARRRHADFVAIGTHGRGAINRTLMGSVAQRVVHHSEFPVLTVRRSDPASGEPGAATRETSILKA